MELLTVEKIKEVVKEIDGEMDFNTYEILFDESNIGILDEEEAKDNGYEAIIVGAELKNTETDEIQEETYDFKVWFNEDVNIDFDWKY